MTKNKNRMVSVSVVVLSPKQVALFFFVLLTNVDDDDMDGRSLGLWNCN